MYEVSTPDCLDALHRWKQKVTPVGRMADFEKAFIAGYNSAKYDLEERNATIAMLAQQLADKKEIIRRLTT
jgi:hypothetical protein